MSDIKVDVVQIQENLSRLSKIKHTLLENAELLTYINDAIEMAKIVANLPASEEFMIVYRLPTLPHVKLLEYPNKKEIEAHKNTFDLLCVNRLTSFSVEWKDSETFTICIPVYYDKKPINLTIQDIDQNNTMLCYWLTAIKRYHNIVDTFKSISSHKDHQNKIDEVIYKHDMASYIFMQFVHLFNTIKHKNHSCPMLASKLLDDALYKTESVSYMFMTGNEIGFKRKVHVGVLHAYPDFHCCNESVYSDVPYDTCVKCFDGKKHDIPAQCFKKIIRQQCLHQTRYDINYLLRLAYNEFSRRMFTIDIEFHEYLCKN